MIGRLSGKLVDIDAPLVVVDVAGVGYEVTLTESDLSKMELGASMTLFIRQVFREDDVQLYGFTDSRDRVMFQLLQTVKGCGPKVAMALLGQVGESAILGAILAQDSRTLMRATGVGLRLAERIILELRDKVQEEALRRKIEPATKLGTVPDDELVDALLGLGYRRIEIDGAVSAAKEESSDVQEQLRHALRLLKK